MPKPFSAIQILLLLSLFIIAHTQRVFAASATLSLVPNTLTVAVNQTFNVEIRVNSGGENINTVTANLTYPADKIKVAKIDTANSFATIWFESSINQQTGKIKLTGSLPSPGTSGTNLLLATLNLQALAQTTAGNPGALSFDNTSAIYRNSDNTNILSSTSSGQYTISGTINVTITPTPVPSIDQPTPTPTLTPTPANLPNVGTNTPTLIFLFIAIFLAAGGWRLIRLS